MVKIWLTSAMLGLIGIGCAAQTHVQPEILKPVPTPVIKTTIIGYSVQHRPIEMRTFNTGERPVLIMGTIHGDETGAATLAYNFAQEIASRPDLLPAVPLVIIPIANPDGYAAKTRTNANKVDLNRNFPARNWGGTPRKRNNYGGENSASEPETIALIKVIEQLNPRLIISIHSMEAPVNNYDGPGKQIAEIMSRKNGYPPTPNIGYPTPGSLGNWAGVDKQIPMVTLELPRVIRDNATWARNRDALLAAIEAVK